jgi:hypothetical protein
VSRSPAAGGCVNHRIFLRYGVFCEEARHNTPLLEAHLLLQQ